MTPRLRKQLPRAPRPRKRLPHAALLVLSAGLSGVVVYLTWPTRGAVFCEQLPQLTALAVCSAALLVFSFRALALAHAASQKGLHQDRRTPGGAAILAALAFFLAAHFIAQYSKPCAAIQRQVTPASAKSQQGHSRTHVHWPAARVLYTHARIASKRAAFARDGSSTHVQCLPAPRSLPALPSKSAPQIRSPPC